MDNTTLRINCVGGRLRGGNHRNEKVYLGVFHLEISHFGENQWLRQVTDWARFEGGGVIVGAIMGDSLINIYEMAINYLPKCKNQRKVLFLNETLPLVTRWLTESSTYQP